MSGKVSGAVWDMDLPSDEMFVLLAYADHADHEGTGVRPGYDLVAWKTGYSRRSVMRIVAKLEAKGIMVLVRPGGSKEAGTLGRPNEWRINIDTAPLKPKRKGRVTPKTPQGDTQDTLMRVTPRTPKSLVEPSEEPLATSAIQLLPEIEKSASADKVKPVRTTALKDAIAIVCKGSVDAWKMKGVAAQLNKALGEVLDVEPTLCPEDLHVFTAYWKSIFKGKDGKLPEPHQLSSEWLPFRAQRRASADIPVGEIRHDWVTGNFEKWDGSTWTQYAA